VRIPATLSMVIFIFAKNAKEFNRFNGLSQRLSSRILPIESSTPINRMSDQEVLEMKAAVIHEFGDVDVLKVEDVQTPKPRQGHVLVKVLAAGVNRLDHYIREGSIVPELSFPHILGADAAVEVFELGRGVTGL